MSEETGRRKIQRLKKECETLRDKLAETTQKLKDQERSWSNVDEKERRVRTKLRESLKELNQIETNIFRQKQQLVQHQHQQNTANDELDNLLKAANEIKATARNVTEPQLQLAVAYVSLSSKPLSHTNTYTPSDMLRSNELKNLN